MIKKKIIIILVIQNKKIKKSKKRIIYLLLKIKNVKNVNGIKFIVRKSKSYVIIALMVYSYVPNKIAATRVNHSIMLLI
jgi:hypothetical protein